MWCLVRDFDYLAYASIRHPEAEQFSTGADKDSRWVSILRCKILSLLEGLPDFMKMELGLEGLMPALGITSGIAVGTATQTTRPGVPSEVTPAYSVRSLSVHP